MSDPNPFPSLVGEHALLTKCLNALEVLANRLESSQDARAQAELVADLGAFVSFLNDFGEMFHHVKEEDVLLPALAHAGFAWDSGPLAHVRKDHDQERYLVRVLEQAASQEGGWSREDRRHAVATVRAFIEFLREHLRKEDETLVPAVAAKLSAEQTTAIDDELTAFDRSHLPGGCLDDFSGVLSSFADKYLES
jgi:hemerythrin-like domain-containing protein